MGVLPNGSKQAFHEEELEKALFKVVGCYSKLLKRRRNKRCSVTRLIMT